MILLCECSSKTRGGKWQCYKKNNYYFYCSNIIPECLPSDASFYLWIQGYWGILAGVIYGRVAPKWETVWTVSSKSDTHQQQPGLDCVGCRHFPIASFTSMTNLGLYVMIGHIFNITLPNFHSEEKSKPQRLRITDLLGRIWQGREQPDLRLKHSNADTVFLLVCCQVSWRTEHLSSCQLPIQDSSGSLFLWPNNQSVFAVLGTILKLIPCYRILSKEGNLQKETHPTFASYEV